MEIVVLDGYVTNPGDMSWDGLETLGRVKVYERTVPEQIVERIGKAQAVILSKTVITEDVLERCSDIRYIGLLSTGYNVVDIQAARKRGIPVCNVPAYSTHSVAQFTIGLLLEVCYRIGAHDGSVHRGDWQNNIDWCYWKYPLIELEGKTLGIIGFGNIGKATARIAKALGMKILATGSRPTAEGQALGEYVDMDTLLTASDVISLHCPLFPETQGLINKATIAKMKDGVIFLNTSRGPLVVEADLAEALHSGKVYAAGVDVVSEEPIQKDNPLLQAPNCIITPHIAWAAKESRQRLIDAVVNNLQAFIEGNPINVVN